MYALAANKSRSRPRISLDFAIGRPYNAPVMDSANVSRIPAAALSALHIWNWWAVPAAR